MKTQYMVRTEGTLAYTDYGGEGELVLMFPGIGALRSEYRYLAPRLLDVGFHPVAVDLRGQGESSVRWPVFDIPSTGGDVIAMLDHLEVESAHMIGTSFAAGSVVWAAAENPDRIRSITLIGPFARIPKISPVMGALFWFMLNNPFRVKMWLSYYGSLYPAQKPPDFGDYLHDLEANLREPGRYKAFAALAGSSRQPSEERLGKVRAPTLVIMGTKDPDFPDPVAEARFLAEQTRGRMELIDKAGHYPQTEMPDRTAALIIDFLKQAR